ncbi:MAG: hypothetical protein APR63_01330 [Desulfuromonas sp. SDB]|nr:MAG: hypothetical protein APR63_01330 [Desulfuromonas sp. SDB]
MNLKLLLCGVLSIYCLACLFAGVDVKVNQDPGPLLQNETSIAYNKGVPLNIVIAYNEDPSGAFGSVNGLGISYSFDEGMTWADTQITQVWGVEADPSVESDLMGNFYVGFISYKGFFTDTNGIFVSRSTDGGITWSFPSPVDMFMNSPANPGPFTDKCYLTVDNSPTSPFAGNVYIAWQRDNVNQTNSDVFFSFSNNMGVSFSTPQRISDLPPSVSQCVGQVPKTGQSGEVFVLWGDFGLNGHTTGYLFIDVSLDGGITWGTDVLIDSFISVQRFPNPAFPGFYVRSYPTLAVDPNNSNFVYAAVAADPDGPGGPDDGDIWFWYSHDGAVTWNGPVVVNDDGSPNDQFQPWMDVKHNGLIDIIWLDRRGDVNDNDFEIFMATSTDHGQTFQPNLPVSDLIFPLLPGQEWMGEYIGIDVFADFAFISWTDTRLGERDIFFDSIHNPMMGAEQLLTINHYLPTVSIDPNPFCTSTEIKFSLDFAQSVSLDIYDLSGRKVCNLIDQYLEPGNHSVVFDPNSAQNNVYFYQLRLNDNKTQGRIVYIN